MNEERRNVERLAEIDQLFKLQRHLEEELETVDDTYLNYKIELINIQKQYVEMRKLIGG